MVIRIHTNHSLRLRIALLSITLKPFPHCNCSVMEACCAAENELNLENVTCQYYYRNMCGVFFNENQSKGKAPTLDKAAL